MSGTAATAAHARQFAQTPQAKATRSAKARERWAAGVYAVHWFNWHDEAVACVRQCQKEGVSRQETADRVGVDVKTLRRWLRRTGQ